MLNKVKVMTAVKEKFTTEQVIRAIQEGVMPDGRETIPDDEAYLKEVVAALKSLDPIDLDEVLEATGCDVAAVEIHAEQLLSDLKAVQADPAINSGWSVIGPDPVPGFSFALEVLNGAAAAAVDAARRCGLSVVFLRREQKPKAHEITKFGISDGERDQLLIDGRTQLSTDQKFFHLPFIWRRDRHAELDGD
jgi:hypothetical protein